MKNRTRIIVSRVVAIAIGFATAFSSMPQAAVLAAPSTQSEADQLVLQEIAANTAYVNDAFNAVIKSRKSGLKADKDKALSIIRLLSPTNKIRLYARLSREYYKKNFRKPGFRYFDVEKYLTKNNDVRQAGINEGARDIYDYALEHYLD